MRNGHFMPVLSDAQPLHDTDGGFEFFGRNSLAILGIHCIEAQFIHWEGLLLNADVFMQFLMRMICICATLVLWIAIKTFFQSVILKTAR